MSRPLCFQFAFLALACVVLTTTPVASSLADSDSPPPYFQYDRVIDPARMRSYLEIKSPEPTTKVAAAAPKPGPEIAAEKIASPNGEASQDLPLPNTQYTREEALALWDKHLKKHGKKYDEDENERRFKIFWDNLTTASTQNFLHGGGFSYRGAFTDLTPAEFKKMKGLLYKPLSVIKTQATAQKENARIAREKNYKVWKQWENTFGGTPGMVNPYRTPFNETARGKIVLEKLKLKQLKLKLGIPDKKEKKTKKVVKKAAKKAPKKAPKKAKKAAKAKAPKAKKAPKKKASKAKKPLVPSTRAFISTAATLNGPTRRLLSALLEDSLELDSEEEAMELETNFAEVNEQLWTEVDDAEQYDLEVDSQREEALVADVVPGEQTAEQLTEELLKKEAEGKLNIADLPLPEPVPAPAEVVPEPAPAPVPAPVEVPVAPTPEPKPKPADAPLVQPQVITPYTTARNLSIITTPGMDDLWKPPVSKKKVAALSVIDWRTKYVLSPVKSQGQCGSCWAMSATAVLETAISIRTKKAAVPLSVQQLLSCDLADQGCEGGNPITGLQYLTNYNIATEEKYPYDKFSFENGGQTPKCDNKLRPTGLALVKSVKSYESNEKSIEKALQRGPVTALVDADSWQFYDGTKIVYPASGCKDTIDGLNHAVVIVGLGELSNGEKYWIVRNHWGPEWGSNGYIFLAYGLNTCGIAIQASEVTLSDVL